MKKIVLITIIMCFATLVLRSQENNAIKSPQTDVKKGLQGDRTMWGIYTDLWQDAPDSIDIKPVNQGFSFHCMYDYVIKGKFSVAIGLGIASHNLYSGSWLKYERDSLNNLTGRYAFYKIPDSINFKNNKFNINYLEIPVELRFRGNGSDGFKLALGFKAGLTMSNHTKYKGDNYVYKDGTSIKEKYYNNKHVLDYRYGVTARIGYKWINLNVFYSLTNLFEDNKGPKMYPVSIGLMITPI